MNVKCVAVDVLNRPNEVPLSRWIIKGKEYTIIELNYMNTQNRILGVKLAEINNDDLLPWSHFRLTRFGFEKHDLEKLLNIKISEVEEEDLQEQLIEV